MPIKRIASTHMAWTEGREVAMGLWPGVKEYLLAISKVISKVQVRFKFVDMVKTLPDCTQNLLQCRCQSLALAHFFP